MFDKLTCTVDMNIQCKRGCVLKMTSIKGKKVNFMYTYFFMYGNELFPSVPKQDLLKTT